MDYALAAAAEVLAHSPAEDAMGARAGPLIRTNEELRRLTEFSWRLSVDTS
jgi:hypothetical protein